MSEIFHISLHRRSLRLKLSTFHSKHRIYLIVAAIYKSVHFVVLYAFVAFRGDLRILLQLLINKTQTWNSGNLFAAVPLYAPDMIRGVTICFLLGDTFTLSRPLINSLLSVADSTARNLMERMCWVTFAIVIMLPASRASPLTGLASLDISVIFTPALFVICSKNEKRCDDGFAGGTSTVEVTKYSP